MGDHVEPRPSGNSNAQAVNVRGNWLFVPMLDGIPLHGLFVNGEKAGAFATWVKETRITDFYFEQKHYEGLDARIEIWFAENAEKISEYLIVAEQADLFAEIEYSLGSVKKVVTTWADDNTPKTTY
jgi:hypothetical protein